MRNGEKYKVLISTYYSDLSSVMRILKSNKNISCIDASAQTGLQSLISGIDVYAHDIGAVLSDEKDLRSIENKIESYEVNNSLIRSEVNNDAKLINAISLVHSYVVQKIHSHKIPSMISMGDEDLIRKNPYLDFLVYFAAKDIKN